MKEPNMATFKEAHQVRNQLKMKLHVYHWYLHSAQIINNEGFGILVSVKFINAFIKKIIPPIINGVLITLEVA